MFYKCKVIERETQPTLAVRTRTTINELPMALARAYEAVVKHLIDNGDQPSGPPYTAYYNMDMQNLDVEMGFQVAKRYENSGELVSGEIPGGRAAICLHIGPYNKIDAAYTAITSWMADNGHELRGPSFEIYLNDPRHVIPDDLMTQLVFPLK